MRGRIHAVLAAACMAWGGVSLVASLAVAQEPNPADIARRESAQFEWPAGVVSTLTTFYERVPVSEVLLDVSMPPADAEDLHLGVLSAALGPGVEPSFRFVQRRVQYEPYVGTVRGPIGALRSLAGNSLDQSRLLVDLYGAKGMRARFVRGRLRWNQAEALIGSPEVDRAVPGDPWLRWLEFAADHWWVEVLSDGRWVAVDPSFVDVDPGQEVGSRRSVHDEVPRDQRARAKVAIARDGRTLLEHEMSLETLLDGGVEVSVDRAPLRGSAARQEEAGESIAGVAPDALPRPDQAEVPVRPGATQNDLATAPVIPFDRTPLDDVLLDWSAAELQLVVHAGHVEVARRTVSPAQLAGAIVTLSTDTASGSASVMSVPFGADPAATVRFVVGSGPQRYVAAAVAARRVRELLVQLNRVELATERLYLARPRPVVGDGSPVLEELVEPVLPGDAVADPSEEPDDGPPVHPAVALHVAAVTAWEKLAREATYAIGVGILSSTDRLVPPVRYFRSPVRVAALRFEPPTPGAAGSLTVWVDDGLGLGGAAPTFAAGLRQSYGLLQSALLGQVLNRVADRPPATAFDVTLQAVGSGSRLSWLAPGAASDAWPANVQAAARSDQASSMRVVGLPEPIVRGDRSLHAWWALAPRSGAILGRVSAPLGAAQGYIAIGEPTDPSNLDSVLASLHDLHEAARWLSQMGDREKQILGDLVPRACAATGLVAELLVAGAPGDYVPPTFAPLCVAAVSGP